MTDTLLEDGLYAYLSAQSTITSMVQDSDGIRIWPLVLPQSPVLPAVVFSNLGGDPVNKQNGKPTTERTTFQIDCYATDGRTAKLLAKAVREALESYVGPMGDSEVQAVFVVEHGVDNYDDVPADFRVTSEYLFWHTIIS